MSLKFIERRTNITCTYFFFISPTIYVFIRVINYEFFSCGITNFSAIEGWEKIVITWGNTQSNRKFNRLKTEEKLHKYWNDCSSFNNQIQYHHQVSVLTRILPVVVCPEISSPAQSLASVTKLPSTRFMDLALPGGRPPWFCWAASFSFCCWTSNSVASLCLQNKNSPRRHIKTIAIPATKVKMLDRRKHQYMRFSRQLSLTIASSSTSSETLLPTTNCVLISDQDIKLGAEQLIGRFT